MIKSIIFDMGGVVFDLSHELAVTRFKELGVADAHVWLNASHQEGIFGQLEGGLITCEEFRTELSKMIGKELTHEQCGYAWKGFIKDVPMRNLDKLAQLRERGYKTFLLSNTNPYVTAWAHSPEFSGDGRSIDHFFDATYFSCDLKLMKPSAEIFRKVLDTENLVPEETLFVDDSQRNADAGQALGMRVMVPLNNADWTGSIEEYLV